jgi:pyruvate ferredoxin oxidoreductase gamma subunit
LYEIRLESIGGLGANLVGKLLGEAAVYYMGLNAQSFASYGSEKRGSPVKVYVRFSDSDKPIRISSPVREPDLLGIFSMGIAGKDNSTAGIGENTAIVVNTALTAEKARDALRLASGRLYVIDALKAAVELKTRVNMIMLGAIAAAGEKIDVEAVKAAVSDTLGKKYPEATQSNLRGIDYGYNNVRAYSIPCDGCYEGIAYREVQRAWGWDNAPIGGINPVWGSTITNRLDSSREGYIPVFNKEKCINCGLCDTTCPDMVFQFEGVEKDGKAIAVNKGIDYYHCKGCMRCAEICPTKALTAELEENYDVKAHNIGSLQLVDKDFGFDAVAANGYVTSESTVENGEE